MDREETVTHIICALMAVKAAWDESTSEGLTMILADLHAASKGVLERRNSLSGPGRQNQPRKEPKNATKDNI